MKLFSFHSKGFRNLKPTALDFSSQKNVFVFVGQNGQGKTNLLEAIYICGLSKSFRNTHYDQWVTWGEEFCHLSVEAHSKDQNIQLEMITTLEPKQKRLKINGLKTSAMDFVGQLKIVFFSPDDLAYMSFAPKWRRHYLDVLLSQLNPDYLKALSRYQAVLKQRNALLKSIRDQVARPDDLDIWDQSLASLAVQIYQHREELLEDLKPLLTFYYQGIAHSNDSLDLKLIYNLPHADENDCLKALYSGRKQDLARGQSQMGPHRDDLQFFLKGQDMSIFASRGEWRSMVLALKFAEVQLFKKKTSESPLVLLDDVFSELDEDRQRDLLKEFKEEQIFLTTTHQSFLEGVNLPMEVYEVEQGEVKII